MERNIGSRYMPMTYSFTEAIPCQAFHSFFQFWTPSAYSLGRNWTFPKVNASQINYLATEIPTHLIPIKIAVVGIKYLGIMVTRTMRTLKEQNFMVLTITVKQDLQKWDRLPLSLAGRVNTVKMNILLRYLYLFQCLPIYLPRSFFNLINSIVSTFIWAGKRARTNKSLLQRSRSLGGLGLPNLFGYYWAANA